MNTGANSSKLSDDDINKMCNDYTWDTRDRSSRGSSNSKPGQEWGYGCIMMLRCGSCRTWITIYKRFAANAATSYGSDYRKWDKGLKSFHCASSPTGPYKNRGENKSHWALDCWDRPDSNFGARNRVIYGTNTNKGCYCAYDYSSGTQSGELYVLVNSVALMFV